MGNCACRDGGEGYGFGVLDVKNGLRLVAGGVIAAAGFTEAWTTVDKDADPGNTDLSLPHSLALVLVLTGAISMAVFALIMLFERTPLSFVEPAEEGNHWKREAADAQVYVTALTLLSTAFYAGVSTIPQTTLDEVLKHPSGYMFLVAALLKVSEYICCVILLANDKDADYKYIGQGSDASAKDRAKARYHTTQDGFWNLGFAFALVAVAMSVDCDPVKIAAETAADPLGNATDPLGNATDPLGNATATSQADAALVAGGALLRGGAEYSGCKAKDADEFVMITFVTFITGLGLIFLLQGLFQDMLVKALGGNEAGELRTHIGLDGLAALVAYTGLSTLAMEVGRGFYAQYYTHTWLSANFLFYAALLFGFSGAIRLQGHTDAGEKVKLQGMKAQQGLVIVAVCVGVFATAALWGADVLYNKLEAHAGKQLALETYAAVTLLVLTSHVVLTKVVEAVVAPGFRLCGVFGAKLDKDGNIEYESAQTTTKRSEMTLGFVLASAVFFAHASWELSLTLLFVGTFAARALGFYMVADDKDVPAGRSVGSLFWDSESEKLELGNNGVLFGSLSLLMSFIFFTVYAFRDANGLVPKDSKFLVYNEAIAWIALLAHLVLTLIGLLFSSSITFSAGKIPLLRFGVSTYVLLVMSASVSINGLSSGLAPYAIPSLLTYISYDGMSRAKF